MTVLPTASEADRADQETFVFDTDRDLGLDITAVRAEEFEHGIDTADRIDQAWSIPYADDDDDLACLAY
ncbi:hypothetical protein ACFU44_04405 [Nocardia rhizosphaerihabitans]|uniref:hypothetical protein n=1 Tax=Nocardia rhizosphaerihabitans TaxID=1691570 RepID=UPI00366F97CD